VSFAHAIHDSVACVTCHTTPVSMAPATPVVTCASCHEEHHSQERACAACHAGATLRSAHARPLEGHRACDDCHAPRTVAVLRPMRAFCLTCHSGLDQHYPAGQCTTCHFLQSPDEYRQHLTRAGKT
jgi:hypothetical protein